MEPFLLKTRAKSKLPSFVHYPPTLKQVSLALHDVPQAQELILTFYYCPPRRRGRHKDKPTNRREVIWVNHQNYPAFGSEWEIRIRAIAKELKPKAQELLLEEGLPRVREWLVEVPSRIGTEAARSFVVHFNEDTETLEYDDFYHP